MRIHRCTAPCMQSSPSWRTNQQRLRNQKSRCVWVCEEYFGWSKEFVSFFALSFFIYLFIFLFSNNKSLLDSAIDCEKRFVSSLNHFVAHFAPSKQECRKSIYFPKIAISLVYSMKMSLYRDEKESHYNLFGACLNVIMRFCCTPAILIYLRWWWWKKPVQ